MEPYTFIRKAIPYALLQGLFRRSNVCFCMLVLLLLFSSPAAFAQAPVANFTASPTSGCAPLIVSFLDQSTGSPRNWNWDFGASGQLSSSQNPTITFSAPGVYSITLVVRNADGTNGITKTNYITVNPSPSPSFSANITTGCVPVNVQFTDQSTVPVGTVTNWEWNFGDNTTSTAQNPSKTYTATGFYSVSLTVTSSTGCKGAVGFNRYIRIVPGVKANFDYVNNPPTCRPPFAVDFINQTSGPGNLTYQWDLGNSNTSTQAAPGNNYAAAGTYTVKMTATSEFGCSDQIQKDITITGTNTSFTSPDTVCLNKPVSFQNTASPAAVSSVWDFGNGAQSIKSSDTSSYSIPGNYTVKLTNTYSSCTDSAIKTITVAPLPTVNFTANNVIACKAPFPVTFTDQSPDAVAWLWNFGDGQTSTQQNPQHTYTTEGEFTVTLTITNHLGCQQTVTKSTFIRIIKPALTITNAPIGLCVNESFTPVADVKTIDGVSSYFWDYGHNGFTSTLQNPPPHIYSDSGSFVLKLRITTNGGCTDSVVYTPGVRVGPPPTVAFTVNVSDTCANSFVKFTNTSFPTDTWVWDFGDGTGSNLQHPTHQYSDTGYFAVKLLGYNNGCMRSYTLNNAVHIKPPVAKFGFVISNCTNRTLVTFTDTSRVNPAYGPVKYLWKFDNLGSSAQKDTVFNFPGVGSYPVTLTVTNGTCSSTFTKTVKLVGEFADFNISDNTLCKNEPFTLTAKGSDPQNITSYEWLVGGLPYIPGGSTLQTSFATPGVYDIGLQITDINNCKDVKKMTGLVTVTGPTALFTAAPISGCSNGVVTFTDASSPAATLSKWAFDFGDTKTQTFTAPPFNHTYTDTGRFLVRLTVSDKGNCSDTYQLPDTLWFSKPLAKFISNYDTICPNLPVKFTDSSTGRNLQYSWSFGDGATATTKNAVHTYTGNDSAYTVKLVIRDTTGCRDSSVRNNLIVVRKPKPAFLIKDTSTICPPMETQFTFQGKDFESLYWDFGDGATSTLANTSHFYNTYGQYEAKLYLTGYGGCVDSLSDTVNVYNPYTATTIQYSPLESCNNLLVDFNITTPSSTRFTFYYGDQAYDTTQTLTLQHFYSSFGFMTPSLLLEDQLGCQVGVNGAQQIKIRGSLPLFGMDRNKFCDTGTVSFTNYSVGNDAVINRLWDFGDGTTTTSLHPIHYFSQPGTYTVKQTEYTQAGCDTTITDTVRVYGTPQPLIVSDSTICLTDVLSLQGNLVRADTAITWAWNLGNGTTATTQNTSVKYATTGTYTIRLEATNKLGCKSDTAKQVYAPPMPVITVANQPVIPVGTSVTMPVSYSANIDTYTWTPAHNLSCADCAVPVASPKSTTSYNIRVEDIYGCTTTAGVTVTVVCNEKNYFVPNTFTPNGDGHNDVFYPRGSSITRVSSMRIFNRWGELVFEKRDFNANDPAAGWNGQYKGKAANADVYVYVVEFICENSAIVPFKGNVALIR